MLVDVKRQDLVGFWRVAPRGRFVLNAQEDTTVIQAHTPDSILCMRVEARVSRPGCSSLPNMRSWLCNGHGPWITVEADQHLVQCSADGARLRDDQSWFGPARSIGEPRAYIDIDTAHFLRGLRFAKIACPRKQTAHFQYDLCGVCFDFDVAALVGLDGPRMAVAYLDYTGVGQYVYPHLVIPTHVCNLLLRLQPLFEKRLRFWYLPDRTTRGLWGYVQSGRVWCTFAGKLHFPSYWPSLIPRECAVQFTTRVSAVRRVLNALPNALEDDPGVRVYSAAGQLRFMSGGVTECLPLGHTSPFGVLLNINYLRDFFSRVPTRASIVWSIHNHNAPVLLADGQDQFRYVMMPMRE